MVDRSSHPYRRTSSALSKSLALYALPAFTTRQFATRQICPASSQLPEEPLKIEAPTVSASLWEARVGHENLDGLGAYAGRWDCRIPSTHRGTDCRGHTGAHAVGVNFDDDVGGT
jgi:hypothetical protein